MKFKFTWGHGVILALLCFIIFICYMVFSIEFFQKSSFDLVTDEYYEDEINYQQEIDAISHANQLKEKPSVGVDSRGVLITFPKEFTSQNTTGKFKLFRPNSKDLDINKKSLELSSDNTILVPANILVKGNYTLKLYWKKDTVNYQMEIPIVWKQ